MLTMSSSLRGSEGYGQRVHDPFLWEPKVWNYDLRQPQTSLSHKAHSYPFTMAMGADKLLPHQSAPEKTVCGDIGTSVVSLYQSPLFAPPL